MKKSKIIIITECPYSGVLRAILNNARYLKTIGFEIQFIIPEENRDRYGETANTNSSELENIGAVMRIPLKKGYLSIYPTSKILEKYLRTKPDSIIISYGSYAGKITRLLFKKRVIAILYHVPQCIDLPRMGKISKAIEYCLERYLARYTSYYLACSPSESVFLNKTFRVNPKKIVFCPNASENIKIKDKGEQQHKFVFIGRLVKSKGVHEILNTFSLLDILNEIAIIGDGPEMQGLKSKFPHAHLLGHLPNSSINTYLSTSKFFVSNSVVEGLPFAALEAMAMGVVPILSAVDGHKDIIIDGCNGFLFSNNLDFANILFKTMLLTDNQYDVISKNAKTTSSECLKISRNNFIKHFNQYE